MAPERRCTAPTLRSHLPVRRDRDSGAEAPHSIFWSAAAGRRFRVGAWAPTLGSHLAVQCDRDSGAEAPHSIFWSAAAGRRFRVGA